MKKYGSATANNGLKRAVFMEDVELVKEYLEYGGNPNQKDSLGRPLLVVAVKKKMSGISMALVAAGTDQNLPDAKGHDAYWHASRHRVNRTQNMFLNILSLVKSV